MFGTRTMATGGQKSKLILIMERGQKLGVKMLKCTIKSLMWYVKV